MHITARTCQDFSIWLVSVPEVPGAYSRADSLLEVADAGRSAVAEHLNVDPETLTVTVDVVASEDWLETALV